MTANVRVESDRTVPIYNECMHRMTREQRGTVKMPIRIYMCHHCKNAFFINPMLEGVSGEIPERELYCIYCGLPVRNEYRMYCNLTPTCFNPDKLGCDCKREHRVIRHGKNPYTFLSEKNRGVAFVRSVCDRIILSNTDDVGITSVPMFYCEENKLFFMGNSEQRIQYCLYCGTYAHNPDHVCCRMSEFCFDLKKVCENEFEGIR